MYLAYKNTNILFKVLPCILIAIFLVMILSSSCFASTTSYISLPSNTQDLINEYMSNPDYNSEKYPLHYIIAKDYHGDIYFAFSQRGFTTYNGSIMDKGTISTNPSITNKYYSGLRPFIPADNSGFRVYFRLVDGIWEEVSYLNSSISSSLRNYTTLLFSYSDSTFDTDTAYLNSLANEHILYCNFDIVPFDYVANPFQQAPVEVATPETMIATKIMSVDFLQVIKEVLATLPILLAVIIGLISLRKAIQLLLQTLRQS